MLAPESIARARRLLTQGQLSLREIALRTGAGRRVLALIALGLAGPAPLELRPEHYARYLPIFARKRKQPVDVEQPISETAS
jgi:hypothetical protein